MREREREKEIERFVELWMKVWDALTVRFLTLSPRCVCVL